MIAERTTNWIAGGAALSWAWMPPFNEALQIVLTLMGIAWLAMQMYYKVRGK